MHHSLYFVVCFISYSYVLVINAFDSSDYRLTIIHANDLLSAFAGVKDDNSLCDLNSDPKECIGGADRIVSKIREFRAREHILFVDVGGNLGGSWFNHFGSKVVIDFMRELQFDVITLGLSDYALEDFKTGSKDVNSYENVTQFISEVSLVSRIVSCNVDVDTKYISNFYSSIRRSTRLLIRNRRVAIIGFTEHPNRVNVNSQKPDRPNHAFDLLKISDPVKCLQEEAENLRKEGIDIIIAIGSGDDDYFKEIASNVSNVDVVIGGYASSKSLSQLKERKSSSYPDFVVNTNSGNVIVATADVFGKSIGRISLSFDRKGLIKSNEGVLIKLDNSIESDNNTRTLIDKYQQKLVIGTTNVFLNGSLCTVQECNLGNVMADSLVFHRLNSYKYDDLVKTFIEENGNQLLKSKINQVRHVIALVNGQIISNSIGSIDKKQYFITKVSLDRVLNANSMDMDFIEIYILSGKTIRDLLEDYVSKYEQDDSSFQLLQVSGIKVVYDLSKPPNQRITDLLVKCTRCPTENYVQLDDTDFYEVLMPKSIEIRSDAFSLKLPSDLKIYDIVEQYVRSNSPINTTLEDRISIRRRRANNSANRRGSIHLVALFSAFISLLLFY